MKPFSSAEWHFPFEISNGQNSISRYFFSQKGQNPKCEFILFQYTNVYLCARCGHLKPMIDENQCPQICACL